MGLIGGIKRFFTGEPVFRPPATAVEIGSDWIKVAKGRATLRGAGIERVRCMKLTAGTSAADALPRLLREVHAGNRNVVVCLPRHLVTVRFLKVPSTNPDEVAQMVSLQAGRQTPYSREEVVSAHRVTHADENGYAAVVLVIARRSIVAERLAALRQAGIRAAKVGFSSEGIWSWFRHARPAADDPHSRQPVAVLDIDTAFSDLIVFNQGRMAFTRSVLIGADHLDSDPKKWQPELIREVNESLDRYKNENPPDSVSTLYLSGSARAIESVETALNESLHCATQHLDPFGKIPSRAALRKTVDTDLRDVSLTSLTGTVLQPEAMAIDLTPPEMHMEQTMEENRRLLTACGLLGIVIVTLASILVFAGIYERRQIVAQMEEQLGLVQPVAQDVTAMERRIHFLNQRRDARGTPLDILTEMHRLTPDSIQLTAMRIDAKQKITLRGRGAARADVRAYIDALEISPLFRGVEQVGAIAQRTVGDTAFVEFAIDAEFAGEGAPTRLAAPETEQVQP